MSGIPQLGYGFIKGRFLAGVLDSDSNDSDDSPDAIPMHGYVVLSATTTAIKVTTATPDPATLFPRSIKIDLDEYGYISYQGKREVAALATDDPDGDPVDWQWKVSFYLTFMNEQVSYPSFNFSLPTGSTVDLTQVTPLITPSPGYVITKGDTGDTGPKGDPGPGNTLAIGTVTTGAPGSDAGASIAGTSPNQTLSLTIPRGNAGATGPAGTIDSATANALAPGAQPTIALGGTPSARTMAFGIPSGDQGPAGKGVQSAAVTYQVGSSGTAAPTGTWTSAVPVATTGQFLWTRTVFTYTDSTYTMSYSVAPAGPKGDKGDTGNPSTYELRGTGSPEGAVTAPPGTYYTDTAGTCGAWRWLKTSGTGSTGWRVLFGDTGWRDVSSLLRGGHVASPSSPPLLRRVNERIYMLGGGGTSGTEGQWMLLPSGFVTPTSTSVALGKQGSANAYLSLFSNGYIDIDPVNGAFISASWVTDQPWPTTLPGTPA